MPVLNGNPVDPAPVRRRKPAGGGDDDVSGTEDGWADSLAGRWLAAGAPRWFTLVDEALYFVASILFVVGSFDFFPGTSLANYVTGCELFIIGSAIFLALALVSAFQIWDDVRRPRAQPLGPFVLLEEALYIVGSGLFLAGTVLFIPPLDGDASLPAAVAAGVAAGAGEIQTQVLTVPYFGLKTIEVVIREGAADPTPTIANVEFADELFVAGSILFAAAAFVSAVDASSSERMATEPGVSLRRATAVATASLYVRDCFYHFP